MLDSLNFMELRAALQVERGKGCGGRFEATARKPGVECFRVFPNCANIMHRLGVLAGAAVGATRLEGRSRRSGMG